MCEASETGLVQDKNQYTVLADLEKGEERERGGGCREGGKGE
jgi:hypothetical protein